MGKEEKRVLTLDKYEHGVVVNALNEMRNDLLEEQRSTDIVDEVLLKAIDAPTKKVKVIRVPEKSQDFLGGGRATERESLCPEGAKREQRSLRGRDEARYPPDAAYSLPVRYSPCGMAGASHSPGCIGRIAGDHHSVSGSDE